jgi:uncharacterized protein YndB with AHSA1/START domain
MTDYSITHASFTLKRSFKANPARVFQAFADKEQKAAWFGDPTEMGGVWDMDFREGGTEINSGMFEGTVHSFEAQYQDIVPDVRIVYSYRMNVDGKKLSASITTFEFEPEGTGTLLVHTEHGAFFDGLEDPILRETGSAQIMAALAAAVDGE